MTTSPVTVALTPSTAAPGALDITCSTCGTFGWNLAPGVDLTALANSHATSHEVAPGAVDPLWADLCECGDCGASLDCRWGTW